jgi:hypothetical protein
MRRIVQLVACGACALLFTRAALYSQRPFTPEMREQQRVRSLQFEREGLKEPFRGVTTNGTVVKDLFPITSTGVTTEPVRRAADAWLKTLAPEQRKAASFSLDDDEWRKWMNQHFYVRQGVAFRDMSEPQREAAFNLLRASLSAKGLKLSRDIMRLNHTLGELNNDNFDEYGEWLYWITVMGTPSASEPWGWQIDGHHLIVNYFVLGDQVVMTPSFFGSEPVTARAGKFAGTAILRDEQRLGLEMIRALDAAQQQKAILRASKTGNDNLGEAFKDNLVLDYAGLRASEMTPPQRERLLGLVNEYIRNMNDGHAKVKMAEVRRHLDATWFAWIGGTSDDSVFYYRVHSPVVLIEFDHQRPAGMRHLVKNPELPDPEHIHVVVRTPNGNDYGKDLLRQHYATHSHSTQAAR